VRVDWWSGIDEAFVLRFFLSLECGTYISPCRTYMNKVYQFVGTADEPATQLITNMNFYASDMCIGIASSFITQ